MTTLPICALLHEGQKNQDCCLRKPIEVGRFSLDGRRQFHHDRHQMSCIVPHNRRPLEKLDLNDGYRDRFVKRDEETKERLDHLLHWMLMNRKRFVSTSGGEKATVRGEKVKVIGAPPDFLLWRGHLTKMMCSPFENRDGWIMACQKLGDTIYVSEVETEEAAFQRRNRGDRERLMTYWGVRFEGYMTGPFPNPSGEAKSPTIVQNQVITNTNEAFCSVLRSRLNQHHSLVFGAEVDCCEPVQVLSPPDCYIELKTSRVFTSRRQEENFYKFKALKWWAQSYLAGIPRIICGFRDDDGHVVSIESFETSQLPVKASYQRNAWDPETGLAFLDRLLSGVKGLFLREPTVIDSVLLLYWMPGDRGVSYNVSNDPKDKFLPQWFVQGMKN